MEKRESEQKKGGKAGRTKGKYQNSKGQNVIRKEKKRNSKNEDEKQRQLNERMDIPKEK